MYSFAGQKIRSNGVGEWQRTLGRYGMSMKAGQITLNREKKWPSSILILERGKKGKRL